MPTERLGRGINVGTSQLFDLNFLDKILSAMSVPTLVSNVVYGIIGAFGLWVLYRKFKK